MRSLLLAGLILSFLVPVANSSPLERGGTYVCLGTHFYWAVQNEQIAWGASAAIVFRPSAVEQISRNIASHGLGLAIRYHRAHHLGNARVEGGDIVLRRYMKLGEGRWHPFLGVGIGQYGVDWDDSEARRSTWSTVLEAGLELDLGSRWLLAVDLLARSLEFSHDSFSGAAVVMTLGARIDA